MNFWFAITENTFKWRTGEPNEVAAGVHIERNFVGIRAEVESESVIAAGGEGEREVGMAAAMVVVVESGRGAGGGGFEEVVGVVEMR